MKRGLIIAATIWLICFGCYDLTLRTDDHTVRDFKVLAVHVEPPELREDEPLVASVLYADPAGEGTTVRAAWSVRLYDRNADAQRVGYVTVSGQGDTGTRLELPAPRFRLGDKSAQPTLLLEVYLCHDGFRAPSRIGQASEAELLATLCEKGEAASGVKFIDPSRPDLAQGNPRIDRVLLNGIPARALEDGGVTIQLCDANTPCDRGAVRLDAYLVPESIDVFSLERVAGDGGSDLDAGIDAQVHAERHRIDWYVTEGALDLTSSVILSNDVEETAGPYRNTWRAPSDSFQGEATLYVVARDILGGNDWRTFRVRFRSP